MFDESTDNGLSKYLILLLIVLTKTGDVEVIFGDLPALQKGDAATVTAAVLDLLQRLAIKPEEVCILLHLQVYIS